MASSSCTPRAVKRLQQDLKSLKESPLVCANAEPASDSNLMLWYGIIIPPESSLISGIPIRFALEFDNEYPNTPPKAYFESYIAYENGAMVRDNKGRIEVCLNIFGNFRGIHTEWGSTSEGWSPSYTVTTILVSMQGMVLEGMLSKRVQDVTKMINSATNFRCPVTKHDGSNPEKYFPKVITSSDEAARIAASFSSTSNNTTPLDTHYICYANQQKTGRNYVLGYGIHIQNQRLGTLTSPCEYLSLDSYKHSGVRKSSTNLPFEHWLPILIDKSQWTGFSLIKKGFLIHVSKICADIDFKGTEVQKVFKVCSSLMNSLVVEIMNNGDNATANDKFLNAYFALYRLLVMYKQDNQELGELADKEIEKAIQNMDVLSKTFVPNLGEFLIYLTLSDKYEWSQLAEVFMKECDARCVFWYIKGNRNNPPKYPELGRTVAPVERATKVFDATAVSRRLVMFQVRFVTVTKNLWESGVLELEGEEDFGKFGLVPEGVRGDLKGIYKDIIGVKDWQGFFEWVGMQNRTDAQRGQELEKALRLSFYRRYT